MKTGFRRRSVLKVPAVFDGLLKHGGNDLPFSRP